MVNWWGNIGLKTRVVLFIHRVDRSCFKESRTVADIIFTLPLIQTRHRAPCTSAMSIEGQMSSIFYTYYTLYIVTRYPYRRSTKLKLRVHDTISIILLTCGDIYARSDRDRGLNVAKYRVVMYSNSRAADQSTHPSTPPTRSIIPS